MARRKEEKSQATPAGDMRVRATVPALTVAQVEPSLVRPSITLARSGMLSARVDLHFELSACVECELVSTDNPAPTPEDWSPCGPITGLRLYVGDPTAVTAAAKAFKQVAAMLERVIKDQSNGLETWSTSSELLFVEPPGVGAEETYVPSLERAQH